MRTDEIPTTFAHRYVTRALGGSRQVGPRKRSKSPGGSGVERRIETFAFNVPVSHRVNKRLVVHANLGWIGQPGTDDRHALFWGAQAEFAIVPDLILMTEVFGTDRGASGGQTGLRWFTDRGRIDLNLLAGQRIDGGPASLATLRVTIRR